MKTNILKKALLFITVASVFLLAAATPIFAFTTRGGEDVNISDSIGDDMFASGNTVIVSGDIEGDLIIAGGRLDVSGKVKEDLMGAGGVLNINGQIGDDVRAAGGMVTINGTVGDDLVVAGGTVTVAKGAIINGDLVIAGGQLNIEGDVNGKLIASGGQVKISGKIGKDAEISDVGSLNITGTAEINGNLSYSSTEKAIISEDAKITGNIDYTEVKEPARKPIDIKPASIAAPLGVLGWMFGASYVIGKIIAFLSLFIIGIILLRVVPSLFRRFNDRMRSSAGICVAGGAITIFGVPIGILILMTIGVILLFTVIGIGISILIAASTAMIIILYWVFIYLSTIFIAFLIGELILSKSKLDLSKYGWKVLAFLIGLAIVSLIYAIPFLGVVARFAGILFGVGGFSILIWDRWPKIPGILLKVGYMIKIDPLFQFRSFKVIKDSGEKKIVLFKKQDYFYLTGYFQHLLIQAEIY